MEFTEDTKIFINKYGIFYESQILDSFDRYNHFLGQIKLKKFIVHYQKINKFTRIPKLYFNMSYLDNTLNFTLPTTSLGTYYKIPETRRNKPK